MYVYVCKFRKYLSTQDILAQLHVIDCRLLGAGDTIFTATPMRLVVL